MAHVEVASFNSGYRLGLMAVDAASYEAGYQQGLKSTTWDTVEKMTSDIAILSYLALITVLVAMWWFILPYLERRDKRGFERRITYLNDRYDLKNDRIRVEQRVEQLGFAAQNAENGVTIR
jgi:hypothetical protein